MQRAVIRIMSIVAATLLAAAVASPVLTATAQNPPAVGSAVQVTANPTPVRAHSSPQAAVNPITGEVVVVEADIRGDHRCAVHLSADGGRSWVAGGDPMTAPFTECSRVVINGPYATLDFDADGVLYMAFRASDPKWANPHPPPAIPRSVFLARSDDGGRTFDTTVVYEGPAEAAEVAGDLPQEGRNDRAMVAAGEDGRVYVGWLQGGSRAEKPRSLVAVSTDGGRTFGEPTDLSDDRGGRQPRLAVGAGGVVHAVYNAATFGLPRPEEGEPPLPQPLVYRRSTDHGRTWSDLQEIAPGTGTNRKWVIAADPASDAAYVVWYGNPDSDERGRGVSWDVFLMASTDAGLTWSDPRVVNEQLAEDGVKRYDPGIAIAPDGRVDIAWYDFRNSPVPEGLDHNEFNAGGFQDVYYTSSNDNGRTFLRPDVRVTDRIIDRRIGVWSNNVHSHTNVGIASTDEAVYLAWQDSRNGDATDDAEDVYAATVLVAGPRPVLGGSAAGASASTWIAAGAGMAVGMGIAMLVAAMLTLQRGAGGAPQAARARRSP